MNWEGFEGSGSLIIYGSISEFDWKDGEITRK
jgi:hypothetical protein